MVMALVSVTAAFVVGFATPPARALPERTVPCSEVIDTTRFPYIGDRRPAHRYRLVLGVVSVPPAYMEQVVPTKERPWAYWRKAGLVVRASGASVTVSVPAAWRRRAAISWGNGGAGRFGSVRIAGCGSDKTTGDAYAGGFYLRSSSACVPLIFTVGTRTQTVRFGVGRRCKAQRG